MTDFATELESRLASADGEDLREKLVLRLSTLEQDLRRRAAAGLPREEFLLCQALVASALAGREILSRWPVGAASPRATGPVAAVVSPNQ